MSKLSNTVFSIFLKRSSLSRTVDAEKQVLDNKQVLSDNVRPQLAEEVTGDTATKSEHVKFDPMLMVKSEYRPFEIIEKREVSPDCIIFKFRYPDSFYLDLPVGTHVLLRGQHEGEPISRSYTPITYHEKGYFELLIKVYPMGRISKYMYGRNVGDLVEMKGPIGRFSFNDDIHKNLGMIAGGSGVTPMLQVINYILSSPEKHHDKSIKFLFANRTEKDVLLHEKLLDLELTHSREKFAVDFILSKPEGHWPAEFTGHISKELIHKYLPLPGPNTLILLCGPTGFNQAVLDLLALLGYTKDMIHKF